MLGGVVQHVTSLAERGQILRRVVCRIVIEVRAGQNDARPQEGRTALVIDRRASAPMAAAPVSPTLFGFVPPHAVAQMQHDLAVRAIAALASTSRASKANGLR